MFSASTEHARDEIEGAEDPAEALHALRAIGGANDEYSRLLAWALLEGRNPAEFHGRSSALDAIVRTSGEDSRELRIALAIAMVQTLGWKLFGTYAITAAGLADVDADAVRQEAEALVDRLLTGASSRR